jgi:hypothetical protein
MEISARQMAFQQEIDKKRKGIRFVPRPKASFGGGEGHQFLS